MHGILQVEEHEIDDRGIAQKHQAAGHPNQGKVPAAQRLQHAADLFHPQGAAMFSR